MLEEAAETLNRPDEHAPLVHPRIFLAEVVTRRIERWQFRCPDAPVSRALKDYHPAQEIACGVARESSGCSARVVC